MAKPDPVRPEWAAPAGEGQWAVLVRAVPGARKSGCEGTADGRLKVRLAAPAVDNKANKALEEFVASALGMRRNRVRLVSGHTSRLKKLIVESDVEPSWGLLGTCGKEQPSTP
ncbi:DUF167 domain-containing protein [Nitratidesulfovibrio termitidis]|uniref:DUF167 domain-containing protein n=1 Tax=Nitratidesulfovibrio termitidis TaxID=42252 RepID=UPI00054FE2C0|nr:DUF167 domain-containing protein [Nitratidesulfovibrio termitidis]